MKIRIAILAAFTFLTIVIHAASLTIPGTANPWLAGMPDGSVATGGSPNPPDTDFAPDQSPVGFAPVFPGEVLTFSVTGEAHSGGSPLLGPDGGDLAQHVAENGIAAFEAPIASVIGVFLDDSEPSLTEPPNAFASLPSAPVLRPGLKQPFFIGDGLTRTCTGTRQQFVVPPGATRLLLGTQDGTAWHDNGGGFEVMIEVHPDLSPVALIRVSQVEVCWESVSGKTYQVQYRLGLPGSEWLDLGAPVIGNGSVNCMTDALNAGQSGRFYRIVPQP